MPNRSNDVLKERSMNRHKLPLIAAVGTAAASLSVCVGIALAAASPSVVTGSATHVRDTSAVLEGTVVPGGAPTVYFFQYGPTKALGSQTGNQSAGSGTARKPVNSSIAGLTPGTEYYYRIGASNSAGTALGSIKSFRSGGNPPPGATTGAVANLTTDSVTLTGVVSPQGQATAYYFRYGLTTAYGLQTAEATVSAGAAPVAVTAQLTGLAPGVMFHYQLVAVHGSSVTTAGADASFETYPAVAPKPRVTASTTPRAIGGRPYTFATAGRIVNHSATPPSLACVGNARITFWYRHHIVARYLVAVRPDCSYAGSVTLSKLPGHGPKGRVVTLSVYVRFGGNHYLAVARGRKHSVRLS
jgi:hypothetical protein